MQKIEIMETELCKLVMDGDCEGVKELLRRKKEILRGVTPQGNSALHVAAARGHHEMVKLLVEQRPCILSTPNLNLETPLHTAARSGNPDVVQVLLDVDNGLQCNCNSHLFPQRIKVEVIRKAQNNKGETALHYAVRGNHLEVVEQLLRKVKGIELIVNKAGESALYTACYYGFLEIAEKLLSAGPAEGNARIKYLEIGKRPLSAGPAVGNTRIRCLEIGKGLLSVGSTVVDTRNDGTSCLHRAIINILEWGDEGKYNRISKVINLQQWHGFALELAFLLVRERSHLAKAVDPSGNSPLHLLVALPVANESHLNLVKKLLIASPNMNFLLNKDDMAPIHIAARDGNDKVIKCLLDSAPHCSYLLAKENKNVLHFALEKYSRLAPRNPVILHYGQPLVPKLDCLLQNSVDIGFLLNQPDDEGKTPLSITPAQEALIETLKTFIDQGRLGTSTPSPNIFIESNASKSSQLDYKNVVAHDEAKGDQSKEDVDIKKLHERFSISAALIATITFAAAFTIPGGLNQDNGRTILMHKVALKVFILCDSLAFSFSLLSLSLLIGSPLKAYFMAWCVVRKEDARTRQNIEEELVVRAIKYLAFSLHVTKVTFATGVYVVVAHKCQWLAVTVCIITFSIPLVDLIWSLLTPKDLKDDQKELHDDVQKDLHVHQLQKASKYTMAMLNHTDAIAGLPESQISRSMSWHL